MLLRRGGEGEAHLKIEPGNRLVGEEQLTGNLLVVGRDSGGDGW
jgi:hypothetical protein